MEMKRGKTVDYIKKQILEDINKGFFSESPRLVTETLAKKYSVSRMPVREALTRLVKEGIVEINRNTGFQLRQLSIHDICTIYEIRERLEGLAAAKVAEICDKKVILKLKGFCEIENNVKSFAEWKKLDIEFHKTICDSCGSKFLTDMIQNFLVLSTIFAVVPNLPKKYKTIEPEQIIKEHLMIIDAIENKNAKLAERCLKKHIASARKRIQKSIKKK